VSRHPFSRALLEVSHIRDIRRMVMATGAWNPQGVSLRFAEIGEMSFIHLYFHISADAYRKPCDVDCAAGFQSREHRPENLKATGVTKRGRW